MFSKKNNLTIYQLLICALFFTACAQNDKNDEKTKIAQEKQTVEQSNKIAEKTNNPQKEPSKVVKSDMHALENIQIDMTNSETYLEMNAKKEGVIKTASGLQYRIITQGTGPKPTARNVVQVHYRGTFPNGEEFDSSYKRGEPTSFGVTRVIKGWTEALLLMNEGSKYELVIPSELAYGEKGAGNIIPPNQVLKFEVELLNANYK